MMRFQLANHGWPIAGGLLIPEGTILDRDDWSWNGAALTWPPPINAIALDQSAYDELLRHYPYFRIQSRPDAGINRHADPKPK
jgi:hypothetical protein